MAIAGRVAIVPKDVYDASLPYKRLDAVMHNNTLYIAKKNVPAGKTPGADTKDYWMSGPSAGASAPATTTSNGLMSATDKKAIEVLKKPLATCATGRAAAAKVATLANFVLQVGTSIAVKFTDTAGTANPTTGNLTLNVNGTGAKTIGYVRNGNKAAISYASGNFFYNNATHIFTYDGTFWLCMDWNADNNTTYSNFVKSGAGAKAGLVPAPSTTAGTSKYLREDGTWQTPPDTKTSVVNNQTTTVAGYALDARQANPNIDGTLAKQVADLNGSLKVQNEVQCTLVNATGYAVYICNGFMVQVIMEITPTKLTHGTILLRGLPSNRNFYMTLPVQNGCNISCLLSPGGNLSIYFPNGNEQIGRIDNSFVYIMND